MKKKRGADPIPRYAIPDFFENPVIRPYLANVRDWQGYIRFLGLPDRRENPDILIDRLFVAPLVTRRYVSPDENPENWTGEAETLIDALAEDAPLVLLGDPGIGKSTFLNFVAWLFSRPASNALIERLGWYLPLPMVLRELPVQGVRDFDGLLEAFLSREMSAPLLGDERRYLMQSLEEGRAFLLLDGIDELGGREARENLRSAVFDGVARYPACRWLLTSRIIGYEEAPFDREHDRPDREAFPERSAAELRRISPRRGSGERHPTLMDIESVSTVRGIRGFAGRQSAGGQVAVRYIAPFDDRRIASFAHNWYVYREAAATRAGANANHLVRAVHADESILRLARVPNLLTMMALIHRIEATLPHGRALLYERIAEAYLESIDKFRGIDASPHDLPRKKGWLARVAFEMQRLRISKTKSDEATIDEATILMDADTVKGWLSKEMGRSNTSPDTPSAEEFLKVVGRRSGLFLPRGEGRYAFVHLSFQEYFAAVALKREVTRLGWAKGNASRLRFDRDTLADWAGLSVWRETFSFLFELLASEEEDDWHADLLDCIFGEGFSRLNDAGPDRDEDQDERVLNLGELLARLVTNSRFGLSSEKWPSALEHCVSIQLRISHGLFGNIFETLLGDDVDMNATVFKKIETQMQQTGLRELDLNGTSIPDLSPITNLTMLESLDLTDTSVSDISPLANLITLQSLNLMRASVSDISPIANLTALRSLDLTGTQVSDLTPLAKLTELRSLDLFDTPASDLAPVMNLRNLQSLRVENAQVSDIDLLVNLPKLQSLSLSGELISDISPLSKCIALQKVSLVTTKISDLSPLAHIPTLRTLLCLDTPVSDLSPLAKLPAFKSLVLLDTSVSDLAPLSNFAALHSLGILDSISDLSPLANLAELCSLVLWVESDLDITPLASLPKLRELSLLGDSVPDLTPLAHLGSLERLDLGSMEISRDGVVEELRKCRPDIKILEN